jgi:hypothetical protein
MRIFRALVSIEVPANSFADAEKKIHNSMVSAFNQSEGEYPSRFDTLLIDKGEMLK